MNALLNEIKMKIKIKIKNKNIISEKTLFQINYNLFFLFSENLRFFCIFIN